MMAMPPRRPNSCWTRYWSNGGSCGERLCELEHIGWSKQELTEETMATTLDSTVRERIHTWFLSNSPSQHKPIIVAEGERQ